MKSIRLLIVIITTLLLNACEVENITPIPKWTWDDTDAAFADIQITPGSTIDIVLEVPEAPYEWSLRIIVPQNIDEVNGNPLVYSMHGGVGGAGRQAHKGLECFTSAWESINAFVISPNADRVQWYETYSQIKVTKLIALALENWPIDDSKIVASGYSDGGNGTWFLAEAYPDVFSAGIALATSYNTLNSKGKPRRIRTPLYVIHSSGDELFPLDQTAFWVERTTSSGSPIEFVIVDGLSHYTPCEYVSYFEDGIQWLQDVAWQEP